MILPTTVITHWVHDEVLETLSRHCTVLSNQTRMSMDRRQLLAMACEAEAIMVFMPDSIDETFLAQCPRLRIVGAALKGYDNFDVAACTRRNIWFTIVPDLLTIPTAELAIGHLIAIGRNMGAGDRLLRNGHFPGWRPVLYGRGLNGAVVGILGMGAVGQAIAERLAPFGCTVRYTDATPLAAEREQVLGLERRPMDRLLAESDFVVVALPLNAETTEIIDARALAVCRPETYLINIGRGSCVDEEAVAEALAGKRLAGYASDVFAFEDWARDDRPRTVPAGLLGDLDRTSFTPHLGSADSNVRRRIALDAAVNIIEGLQGRRPHGAINTVRSATRPEPG